MGGEEEEEEEVVRKPGSESRGDAGICGGLGQAGDSETAWMGPDVSQGSGDSLVDSEEQM